MAIVMSSCVQKRDACLLSCVLWSFLASPWMHRVIKLVDTSPVYLVCDVAVMSPNAHVGGSCPHESGQKGGGGMLTVGPPSPHPLPFPAQADTSLVGCEDIKTKEYLQNNSCFLSPD